jgi:hypothetical protein
MLNCVRFLGGVRPVGPVCYFCRAGKRIEYKFMTVGTPSGTFALRLYYKYVIHLRFFDGFICRAPQLTAQSHTEQRKSARASAGGLTRS